MTPSFRVTEQTRAILGHIIDNPDDDHYGFEILKATGLTSGTLYPTLARLEDAGWIESRWEQINPGAVRRPARRYYRLTESGVTSGTAVMRQARRMADAL